MGADLDVATEALRRAKAMKEEIVKRHGVGEDLVPHLDLWVGGLPWMTVFMNGKGLDHAKVIVGALGFSRCDLAVMVTEGYSLTSSLPHDDRLRRGELAERFAAGDPAVREGLIIGILPREGSPRTWTVTYRYDGRAVVWGDEDLSDNSEGIIPQAAAFGYAHRAAEERLMDHDELTRHLMTLGTVEAVGQFIEKAPPRNAPCPCGSGQKAKRCGCHN